MDTTGTGAAIGGSSDVVTPQKPRRSSRFQGASGSSGSGSGAVNYDERRDDDEGNDSTPSRPVTKRGRVKRVAATGLGRGVRRHGNKRAALRVLVRVTPMRCDYADDIGAGEADVLLAHQALVPAEVVLAEEGERLKANSVWLKANSVS